MNHNLNIQSYTLDEIFGLFNVPPRSIFSMNDLKNMKRQVLYTHPDKSRFPPEYFIFYKKAFEIMVQYYEANCKFYDIPPEPTNRPLKPEPKYPGYTGGTCGRTGQRINNNNNNTQTQTHTSNTRPNSKYDPIDPHIASEEQVKTAIRAMSEGAFHRQFNELYEKNITDHAAEQRAKRFGWFSDTSSDIQVPQNVSKANFGESLEQVRQTSTALTRHRAEPSSYNVVSGAGDLYGDLASEDADDEAEDVYISCDPFSKLKFDDLRKVHKDQTVFAVSERNFKPETKHQSVDMFNREWSKAGTATPLEKAQAEHMLREQERIRQERLATKQYQATQRALEYEEKNKAFLSNFLRLT
jgi:hypothetical protein